MEALQQWDLFGGHPVQGLIFGIGPITFGPNGWKAWAPSNVKFFAWLALQDRIWTADRLAKLWPMPSLQEGARNWDASVLQVPFHR